VADMDILRKIVLGEPSMFRDKDNRHKVTSSQSLWINPLNQFSLGLVEIKIDLEDRGRGPRAKYFI
jgi:hypothetical protein